MFQIFNIEPYVLRYIVNINKMYLRNELKTDWLKKDWLFEHKPHGWEIICQLLICYYDNFKEN